MLNSGKALLCTQLPVQNALPLPTEKTSVFFKTQSSYLTPGLGPGHAGQLCKVEEVLF